MNILNKIRTYSMKSFLNEIKLEKLDKLCLDFSILVTNSNHAYKSEKALAFSSCATTRLPV